MPKPPGQTEQAEARSNQRTTDKTLTQTDSAEGTKQPIPAQKSVSKERKYAQEDLDAQLRMAKSAERIVIPAWLQIGIGFIGLLLIGGTVYYAKKASEEATRAADAVEETLSETRRNSYFQLRAYVVVDKATVTVSGADDIIEIETIFKNTGQTPAFDVTYELSWGTFELPEEQIKFEPSEPRSGKFVLGPSQAYMTEHGDSLKREEASLLRKAWQIHSFFVWGQVKFRDVYAKSQWMTFRFRTVKTDNNVWQLHAANEGNDASRSPPG